MMHEFQPVVDLLPQEFERARRRLDRAPSIAEPVRVFRAADQARDLDVVNMVLADLLDLPRDTDLTAGLPGRVKTGDLLVHAAFAGLDLFCRVET